MKEYTKTTFECEFCKKLYKLKHAGEKHEKYCTKNPANFHACFSCNYLEVGREYLDGGMYDRISVKTFRCKLLERDLHSFKAERMNHSCLGSTDRMPLECEHFILQGITSESTIQTP